MDPSVHVSNEEKNPEHLVPQKTWDQIVADAEIHAKEAAADGR